MGNAEHHDLRCQEGTMLGNKSRPIVLQLPSQFWQENILGELARSIVGLIHFSVPTLQLAASICLSFTPCLLQNH